MFYNKYYKFNGIFVHAIIYIKQSMGNNKPWLQLPDVRKISSMAISPEKSGPLTPSITTCNKIRCNTLKQMLNKVKRCLIAECQLELFS